MNIKKTVQDTTVTFEVDGSLNTLTAPQLETEIKSVIKDTKELVFDFKNLEYLSSAGLRVLLSAQNVMDEQGTMLIKNVNATIMEVFEITGFVDIIKIEK